MARRDAWIFFVLPTFPDRVSEERLEVVGARECLLEAGLDVHAHAETQILSMARAVSQEAAAFSQPKVTMVRADAKLYPYGAHPQGPVSERIYHFMTQERLGGARKLAANSSAKDSGPAKPRR
jgi:hypothetical protein